MNSDTWVGTVSGVFGGMNDQRWVFIVLVLGLLAVALLVAFVPSRQRR